MLQRSRGIKRSLITCQVKIESNKQSHKNSLDRPNTTLIGQGVPLLMFVTPGSAYLYNSVAGCCVSHHGVRSIDPFRHETEVVSSF